MILQYQVVYNGVAARAVPRSVVPVHWDDRAIIDGDPGIRVAVRGTEDVRSEEVGAVELGDKVWGEDVETVALVQQDFVKGDCRILGDGAHRVGATGWEGDAHVWTGRLTFGRNMYTKMC